MGNKLRTQIVDKSEKLSKLVRVTSHSSHMKHDLIYGLHGYSRFSHCRIFRFVPFRSGLSLFPIGERARIFSHHRKVVRFYWHSTRALFFIRLTVSETDYPRSVGKTGWNERLLSSVDCSFLLPPLIPSSISHPVSFFRFFLRLYFFTASRSFPSSCS